MQRMQFGGISLAVCLVYMFVIIDLVTGQTAPQITEYVDDEIMHIQFPGDGDTVKTVECLERAGKSFLGITFRDNTVFSSTKLSLNVDMKYTSGDYESLQQLRTTKLGPYHCLYRAGSAIQAYSIILSEVPIPGSLRSGNIEQVGPNPGENELKLSCTVPLTTGVVWERLNDKNGLFEPFRRQSYVALSYSELSYGHGDGFTMFRCFSKQQPETFQYIQADYSYSLLNRPVRNSNYSSTTLPFKIRFGEKISLECHGDGTSVSEGPLSSWYFKPKGSTDFIEAKDTDNQKITRSGSLTTLVINQMNDQYVGWYRCQKDKLNHFVQLTLSFGDVIIRDYSKNNYTLKPSGNYITCIIPEVSKKEQAFWKLRDRKQRLDLQIRAGAPPQQGFTASYDSSGNLVLTFDEANKFSGARLECHFYQSVDYTILRVKLPKLTLSDKGTKEKYYFVECRKDTEFGGNKDLEVYELKADDSLGKKLNNYGGSVVMQSNYIGRTVDYGRLVCQIPYGGVLLKSNVLVFGAPEVTLDIYLDKMRNPSSKVFLSGRRVDIHCHFPSLFHYQTIESKMQLLKDGARYTRSSGVRLNQTTWLYSLENPGQEETGSYRCRYEDNTAPTNYLAKSESPTVRLDFCTTAQFVCDGTCKDRSLMCDKRSDCRDGSDEKPDYCDKCEPNAIKCETYKGSDPLQRCVLKHWLCDGQDDCGNGFDEDLDLHRKWCYKDSPCSGCKPHETCCPGTNKCIWRSYECDKERDCSGSMDEEMQCSPADCLKLEYPVSRVERTEYVGQPFSLNCTALGMDRPTINWRRNWGPIPKEMVETNTVILRDETGKYRVLGTLSVARATEDMAGIYNCEAVNNCKRELSLEMTIKVLVK